MNEITTLAHGIDSLYLTYSIHWENDLALNQLKLLKEQAQKDHKPAIGYFPSADDERPFMYEVEPYSSFKSGYAYILKSNLYNIRMTAAEGMGNIPEIYLQLSSETLWRNGLDESMEYINSMLELLGAQIKEIRVSRVDLACDIQMPEKYWRKGIIDKKVTKAVEETDYGQRGIYTGMIVGTYQQQLRLYDKVREIETVSKKYWMYGIWGQTRPDVGTRIIRCEFQTGRQTLKSLGIDTYKDLLNNITSLWAYNTEQFIRFTCGSRKRARYDKLTPWWKYLQGVFGEGAEVLRKKKVVRMKLNEYAQSKKIIRLLAQLMASEIEQTRMPRERDYTVKECLQVVEKYNHDFCIGGLMDSEFNRQIQELLPKNQKLEMGATPF